MDKEIFLSAKWEKLIHITYRVKPDLLLEYLPSGIEVDMINGYGFVSIVAFDFKDTKIKGLKIPFHENFPEINFRFYVKEGEKKGIVFIREFVPKSFVTIFANLLYNEKYKSIEMKSRVREEKESLAVNHKFKYDGKTYEIMVEADNQPYTPSDNSIEHFIKQRQWGYSKSSGTGTLRYRVEHDIWKIYPLRNFSYNIDFKAIYGSKWQFLNDEEPYNILLADGSQADIYEWSLKR